MNATVRRKAVMEIVWCLPPSLCLALVFALTHGVCLASGFEKLDSIHFNGGSPDFGTVPRRGVVWYEPTDRPLIDNSHGENGINRFAQYELTEDQDEGRRLWRRKLRGFLFHKATVAEKQGNWSAAISAYEEIARRLGWTGGFRDRVEVLDRFRHVSRLEQRQMLPPMYKYLGGLALTEGGQPGYAEEAFRKVAENPEAGLLREHARYQLASVKYDMRDFKSAIAGYQDLLKRFPKTRKAEAALIMIGRCSIIPAKTAQEAIVGSDAIKRLLAEYPRTRFRTKALGLAARVHFLAGRLSDAAWCYFQVGDLASVEIVRKGMPAAKAGKIRVWLFSEYLKRLGAARTYYVYGQSIYALDRLSKQLTGTDGFRINVNLVADPEVASAYLYYRLYHCENTSRQLRNLAHLGNLVARKHSWQLITPGVRVRLAEVFYQHREYQRALEWVNRVEMPSVFDRSLFVKGAALHKLHRIGMALREFHALVSKFPKSSLVHGAREEMAILYEEQGERGNALREYFKLGYQADAAFLMDVWMSIPELERYYQSTVGNTVGEWELEHRYYYYKHPREKPAKYTQRELVAYSLGIRYMRLENWQTAAAWFRRVPRNAYNAFNEGRKDWGSNESPDPLTAIREMSRLERRAQNAPTANSRAEALYKYASYYYKHGTLLLYNSAAWRGERREGIADFWNKQVANASNERAVKNHMYEHDVYARTLAMCKEIARRYPHTMAAPKALYRAACSANYLSDFNEWWRTGHKWRGGAHQGDRLAREAAHLMNQIARLYPKDPLAAPAAKYAQVFASLTPSDKYSSGD